MENAYVLQLNQNDNQHQEFYLCFCGYADCAPGHSFGPAVRGNYLLHVVLEGEGEFHVDGKVYHLKKGQGFLIEPRIQTFYKASGENPWSYMWIGFNGTRCEKYLRGLGLNKSHPIFRTEYLDKLKALLLDMLHHSKIGEYHDFFLQGYLYQFLGYLAKELTVELPSTPNERRSYYVRKAVEYINNNYVHEITVQDVADFVCINRSYLCTLFKKELGISPQQYLSEFRLDRGADMLSLSDLSIENIAVSCGYRTPLVFSKTFKRKMGVSPNQYRKDSWKRNKEKLENNKGELASLLK